MTRYDTVVIGAGTAGLITACHLAQSGQKVLVVAKGMGALLLASGSIDVLGFHPADSLTPVKNPAEKLDDFLTARPDHPYNLVGKETLKAGLDRFLKLVNQAGLDYQGNITQNWMLPSGLGAVHPTCLAPASMVKGDLTTGKSMLIVGFNELRDFFPALIAQNINEQKLGVEAGSLSLDTHIPISGEMNATPIELARAFEQDSFRNQVVKAIAAQAKAYDRVGFPAALGIQAHATVVAQLEKQLNRPVFEISSLPPSVPGRRLYEALKAALLKAGGRLIIGSQVIDGVIENGRITQIRMETASRLKAVKATNYVLATGGIFGGGILADAEGTVSEPIFNLPVAADTNRHLWFEKKFISPTGQPVFNFGVKANARLQPVNGGRRPVAENLYVAGAVIAGSEWTRGRTGEGIAVATAAAITELLAG
jgi:glycerol-3-phosphate dehydrogenase subunit B